MRKVNKDIITSWNISPGIGESEENFSNCGCSTCNCRTQRLINELPSSIPLRPRIKGKIIKYFL